jgi:hypothetical protein
LSQGSPVGTQIAISGQGILGEGSLLAQGGAMGMIDIYSKSVCGALRLPLLLFLALNLVAAAMAEEPAKEPVTEQDQADQDQGKTPDPDPAAAPEQSRESMAVDSSATQWSFQFAWQGNPTYHQDELDDGTTRPQGSQGFFQFRLVMPIPPSDAIPFTILPRLTLRRTHAQNDKWGGAPAELFVLLIPWDWGTGRFGAGPLMQFPSSDSNFGSTEFGYGFSAALIQRGMNDKLLYGVLVSQAWSSADDFTASPLSDPVSRSTKASPIGINPFITFQLGGGFYVHNGEMVAQYDWNRKEFYLPIGVRFGKVFVQPAGSWNVYGEYVTSVIYGDWSRSAIKNSYRINLSYTIPVG